MMYYIYILYIFIYTYPGVPISRFVFWAAPVFGRRPTISERQTFGVIFLCFGVVVFVPCRVFGVPPLVACVMFWVETKKAIEWGSRI